MKFTRKGIGNKNAKKPTEEVLSSFLYIRCKQQDKSSWIKAADQYGLSKWVVHTLNEAAKK